MVSSKTSYMITQPFVLSRQQEAQGTWQNFIVPLTGIYYGSSAVNYVILSYFRMCCLREWWKHRINGTCAVDKTKSVTPAWTIHSFLRLLEQITQMEWLRQCRYVIVLLWKLKCKTVLTGQKSRGWTGWSDVPPNACLSGVSKGDLFLERVFTDAISEIKMRSYYTCGNDHHQTFYKQ